MKELEIQNIDKTDWKKYRFEEIAASISERVEPQETDLDIYVGLEHLDAESLHIKRTGSPSDVKGTKLKVYKGDVIFGKRRAYQRKAAVAHFDGICSAHAMVLRANKKVIDPMLFPFFIHSDYFMHRAIDISVGGLSPTINWGTLKTQEFLLPLKDQQTKLAELFWAADEMLTKYNNLEISIKKYIQTYLDNKFSINNYRIDTFTQTLFPLKDCIIGKAQYGANAPSKPFETNSPRYIRITDLNEEGYLIAEDKVTINSIDFDDYLLKDGDFLFARTGNTVGKTLLYKEEMGHCVYAGYLIRFKLNPEVLLPGFLDLFCRTTYYRDFIKKSVKVGAQPNINAEQYSNMLIPVPSISIQKQILNQFVNLKSSIDQTKSMLMQSLKIQKHLLNQIFSD